MVAGLIFAHRTNSTPPPLPKIPPRVAILKPLRGMSDNLRDNIISFLEIAYSRVEYIFGVDSYEDRAIDVPVSLRAPYQFANITVTVGDEPGCSNRKVAKLVKMARRASDKTDIFVLSDADISVEPDHLRRVVSELTADAKTGIVTCIYRGRAYDSFASRMEALFINTDFAPQVILAEALEPMHYALGATIAVKTRGAGSDRRFPCAQRPPRRRLPSRLQGLRGGLQNRAFQFRRDSGLRGPRFRRLLEPSTKMGQDLSSRPAP